MGLTSRRRSVLPFETWPNLEAAAETRYWDAVALAVSEPGREAGAIYLFGYVAEILLKAAYCQYNQLPNNVSAYGFLSSRSLTVHPVSTLAVSLINARSVSGNPMRVGIAADLTFHARIVDENREVTMRYYDFPATGDELNEVFTSVEWIRTNYGSMWT